MSKSQSNNIKSVAAIVMAAGRGSRLGLTDRPKPMAIVGHKTVIESLLNTLTYTGVESQIVVVGHLKEVLITHLKDRNNISFVTQEKLNGTAGAVKMALTQVKKQITDVVVFPGDNSRFLSKETILNLILKHQRLNSKITVLLTQEQKNELHQTFFALNKNNQITERKLISENPSRVASFYPTGILALNVNFVRENSDNLPSRPNGEKVITGLIDIALEKGVEVNTIVAQNEEVFSINTPEDQERAQIIAQKVIGSQKGT
jgi:bifunctional N-acetylglucosamine-1-phosphate-uridyltransferase/glucosamine-1-phosphate-acetyltransferase GlmU-like protein